MKFRKLTKKEILSVAGAVGSGLLIGIGLKHVRNNPHKFMSDRLLDDVVCGLTRARRISLIFSNDVSEVDMNIIDQVTRSGNAKLLFAFKNNKHNPVGRTYASMHDLSVK